MTTHTRRGTRLLALSLATGTAVVTAAGAAVAAPSAPSAPAATSTTSSSYSAQTSSSVANLVLNLPSSLAAATTALLPNPAQLGLIGTQGAAQGTSAKAAKSTSVSDLAFGSAVTQGPLATVLKPLLTNNLTATLQDPSKSASKLPTIPSNPLGLGLGLGNQAALVNTATGGNSATSQLVSAGLGSLSTVLGPAAAQIRGPLNDALTQLSTALQQLNALKTATQPLSSVIGQINSAANSLNCGTAASIPGLGPVIAQLCQAAGISPTTPIVQLPDVNAVIGAVQGVPALLQDFINKLFDGPLVALDGVSSSQQITPGGSGATAQAASNLADLKLLGGLVTVTGGKASATATATGAAGGAKGSGTATLLKATVGTDLNKLLDVTLDAAGLSAVLGSPSVVSQITDATTKGLLDAATSAINTAVNLIKNNLPADLIQLNVLQGTVQQSASKDGTHAEAHAAPAQLTLGLSTFAPNLLGLQVGRVDAVVDRTVQVAPPAGAPSAPQANAKPTAPTRRLAYTGADLPLTAGTAVALLGLGAVAARRRRASADAGA